MDRATNELDRIGTASILHGRAREQQELFDYARSSIGGRCNCILITGPPGVGKSAFADAARAWFDSSNAGLLLRGKYEQFQLGTPYAALTAAFRQLVDHILTEGENAGFEKWKADIKHALGANGQSIVDIVPEVEEIIGPQAPMEPLAPSEERNRFMRKCRDFVAAIATRDHPLCLILDDLQWADAASLGLLKSILSSTGIGYLLVIATYRTDECQNNVHLSEFLREVRENVFPVHEIQLTDLDEAATTNLVSDLLRCSTNEIAALARVIWLKTGGNPFYASRFLHALAEENLLKFDPVENCWVWDHAAVMTRGVTENIAQFLSSELLKLQPETRTFLSRAACIGGSFSLGKCWPALGLGEKQVHKFALEAEHRGFVTNLLRRSLVDDGGKRATTSAIPEELFMTFAHDRVQQAARDLIPQPDLPRTQLEIGRKLLTSLSTDTDDEVVSSVLNNMNPVADLLTQPSERLRLANLNLKAAARARRGLAYHEALNRVHAGLNLLTQDSWQTDHETIFSLSCHGFECAFLVGNFAEAESLFHVLIAHAKDNLERARVWHTQVLLKTSRERYAEALDVAMSALKAFKIRLPRRPRLHHFLLELMKTQALLRGRRASDLMKLPEMKDPYDVEAAKLLVSMVPPAYFLNQELFLLAGLKVVNLSLRKGNSPMSPGGYVVYSLGLTAVLGFPVSGWEFGKLAVDLADRYDIEVFKCKPLLIFAVFINFWRQPLRTSDPILERALKSCLTSGDLQYANYCIIGLGHHAFIRGDPIQPLLDYFSHNESIIRENHDPFAIETLLQWKQCAKALVGRTHSPSTMSDGDYDESEAERRIRTAGNSTLLAYLYIRKVFLETVAGDPARALEIALKAKPFLRFTPGNLIIVDYHFWSAIAAARVLMRGSSSARVKWFLQRRRRTLAKFSHYCPANFSHLLALVDAEIEAINTGDLRSFDRAIALASERSAPHIRALGCERAAEWYQSRNQLSVAEVYYRAAREWYGAWGAKCKVAEMDACLRTLGGSEAVRAMALFGSADAAASRPTISAADFAALAESVAADGGIEAQITSIMELALRFLPGTRIVLIATSEKECRVETVASYETGERQVTFPRESDTTENFSRAVANSVRRTNCPLHLRNPEQVERFSRCPYLNSAKLAVTHALPIDGISEPNGNTVPHGVLLFEFNSAVGAEGDATAIADVIGKELNTVLRQHRLERELADTRARLQNLTRFVPVAVQRRILDAADGSRWEKERKEVAVVFIDMDDYTKKCEKLDEAIVDLIQQYYSAVLDEVRARGGDMCDLAGDGLMILFQGEDLRTLVSEAFESALAVRRRIESLNGRFGGQYPPVTVHIGVHGGIASVGPIKLEGLIEHRWVYSATGSTVNIASRIGDLADDGCIFVSEETGNLVRQRYTFRDLGFQNLKHVSEPVRVLELAPASVG
jgi:predicted ATPase/class 3 adenylate cyclase